MTILLVLITIVCSSYLSAVEGDKHLLKLMKDYGMKGRMTPSGVDKMLVKSGVVLRNKYLNCSVENCTIDQCMNGDNLFQLYYPSKDYLNSNEFEFLSPSILYQVQNAACKEKKKQDTHAKPTSTQTWGYSILCVTVISCASLLGALFHPLSKTKVYKKILAFMVCLAVGTLVASAILVLIPEALELTEGSEHTHTYENRCVVVVAGLYGFFLVERFIKFVMEWRERKYAEETQSQLDPSEKDQNPLSSIKTSHPHQSQSNFRMYENNAFKNDESVTIDNCSSACNISQKKRKDKEPIKPVAWMIVFGDGVHNFMDGLSIGAAFTGSILAGVSVSIAIFCEELPHELGDFAILLNSGMNIKQAMLCNFLSACTCYAGMIAGILIGENSSGDVWIFGLTGGMFLYISLVDMLPEVNHAAEEEAKQRGHRSSLTTFLLQNAGLLSGIVIIYLISHFAGNINFE